MFSLFPKQVNEKSARIVAAGVVFLAALSLFFPWVLVLLSLGFFLRIWAGDRFSPLARIANRIIAPRLGSPIFVPGPPKRFAQGMGLFFSLVALSLFLSGLDYSIPLFFLIFAASFEAVLGICLGCRIFALLMKTGLIPEKVCEACASWTPR